MEDKIKELIMPYLLFRHENNTYHINEIISFIKEHILKIDLYDLGKLLEEDYLRHVDFDLLIGLEQIKQQFKQ